MRENGRGGRYGGEVRARGQGSATPLAALLLTPGTAARAISSPLTTTHGPARMHLRLRQPFAAALLLGATAAACAGRGATAGEAADAAPRQAAPLAVFRAQSLVVTPVQRWRSSDDAGWSAASGDSRGQLASLDSAIVTAVRGRGVTGWAFAPELERAARRNPTMAADPHALAIDEVLVTRQPALLAGPLGSQLRALVALDGQRYVLVPAELRWVRRADGRGEAVLRLVLVDARLSRPLWNGEVRSAPADGYSRALLAGVANQLADLISPPDGAAGA